MRCDACNFGAVHDLSLAGGRLKIYVICHGLIVSDTALQCFDEASGALGGS